MTRKRSAAASFTAAVQAICAGDAPALKRLLTADAALSAAVFTEDVLFTEQLLHWLYVRDSLLHLSAAARGLATTTVLLAAGCPVDAASGRRKATPLHYAADGFVSGPTHDEAAQAQTITLLITHGANVDAQDANGATPLHRAVRCRCAAAVEALIAHGCNVNRPNKSGSTPLRLAQVDSGRGGSGDPRARSNQATIADLLSRAGGT